MKTFLSLLLTVVCILFVQIVSAQNALVGRITDESNAPLVGATVYIPELKRGTATDTTGNFFIDRLPQRMFLIEVRYVGYATRTMQVIPSSTPLHISMSHAATEIEGIVVTGVSAATERKRNPIPTLAVKRETMLEANTTNAVDALSKLPGVSQITTGNAVSKPVIRGLGYNRVVVLQNGIRQEGQQWGDEHGVELDGYNIDRVEIVKGPGSIMYGSDALAGVINFQTPLPVPEKQQRGEALLEYQSNGNMAGASLMQTGNANGIDWLARGSAKKAGNYRNAQDGLVANSGYDEQNGFATVGLSRSWGRSHVSFSTFNQRIGLVEGERDSSGFFTLPIVATNGEANDVSMSESQLSRYRHSVDIPYQRIGHYRAVWSSTLYHGSSKFTADVSWQQNQRREYSNPLKPDDAQLHFVLQTLNADFKYFLPQLHGVQVTTGLSFQDQRNRNKGMEFLIPAYTQWDGGAFSLAEKTFGKWYVGGGVRYDSRWLAAEGLYLDADGVPTTEHEAVEIKFIRFDRTFHNASASLGTSYQWSSASSIRLNIARGFRTPNLAELGSNGEHEGTFRYETGNRALNSETGTQGDVGFNYNGKHVTVDLAAFANAIDGYIYTEKINAASGDSLINGLSAFRYVQNNALLYGGEATLDLHPHPFDWLHVETSASFVRGVRVAATDSTRNLPFIPAPKIRSELRAHQQTPHKRFANSFASLSVTCYLNQNKVYTAYNTETSTPGYFLLDASIGTDVLNANKKTFISLYLTASNLLNKTYQSHLSRLKYAPLNPATNVRGVFNPGRNIGVKIVLPMTFR